MKPRRLSEEARTKLVDALRSAQIKGAVHVNYKKSGISRAVNMPATFEHVSILRVDGRCSHWER